MKYPSASEILSELETAKETDKITWWKDLISIPFDKLDKPTGKLQILYKGKPLYTTIKGEQVLVGSSHSGMYDYNASVKLGEGDAYKLVELVSEIVQSLVLAYKAIGTEDTDIDPIMQHLAGSCNLTEVVELTATEFTSKAKSYDETKYLDLKLFPSYVTVRTKDGISEETLTSDDLKLPRKVNQVFKVGSKVSCVMIVGVYIGVKYVGVTATAGSQSYVDQRQAKTHLSLTQIKDMFDIDLEDDNDN